MEALILAAGYATRLGDLTKDCAKPLLPVGKQPMIDYIVRQLQAMAQIGRITVVTNQKFAAQFADWAASHQGRKPISVINDRTSSDEDKLGAVGDIRLVLRANGVDDDLLVVAGDNLFDFQMDQFVAFFQERGSCVGLYDTHDLELMKQYATVQLDQATHRIVDFVEKPSDPKSTLAATAIYLWKREHVPLVELYAQEGGNMDAPGHYMQWLTKQVDVHGFRIPGRWMDIGNRQQYEEACRLYT